MFVRYIGYKISTNVADEKIEKLGRARAFNVTRTIYSQLFHTALGFSIKKSCQNYVLIISFQ